MKSFRNFLLLALAAVATCLAPAAAWAQDIKPVAVVSIASIDENLADIGYLTVTAGMEDAGKTARLFGSALTAGMDKKRPLGMYVVPKDGDFHAVAFLPVSDLKQLLEIHKEYIGEPRDAGDGVQEIGMGKSAFIKEQKGWAFVAESADHLTGLPQDPSALLANLPKDYNIAVKVMVQNIPQELKQTALDEIKFGLERALDAQAEGGQEIDKESVERAAKGSLAGIEQILNDGDEFVVGWAVDAAGKRTHLDVLVTAKEGSDLASQMALNAQAKSSFTGMLLPEASVTMNFSAKLSENDIAQMQSAFKTLRDQSSKKIAEDPNLTPEQQKVANELVDKLLTVFEDTAKTGKLDGGAALILQPKSLSMVGGGYVADGAAFEQSIKELVDLAKNEPNFPEVKMNAGTHGNVKLHKVAIPIPGQEEEAREILGDRLDIVIGTGPKAAYVSAGKNAEALLKKVIDQSAQAADKAVPTMQLNVSVLPILKFFASVDDNPMLPGLVASLEKSGNDKVVVTSQGGARSSTIRIEIQEGLIRLIGEPLKQAIGNQQGPGAF